MCKNCAKRVHTLVKSRGSAYILCATLLAKSRTIWKTTHFCTFSSQLRTPIFSTVISAFLPLLHSEFSTLSTVPITNTIF